MSDKKNKPIKQENNEIEILTTQVADLEDKWKRSMADYINYKKRVEQEKSSLMEFANLVLIKNLLPTIDNLLLASKHTEDVGIKMIYEQFQEVLKNQGVTKIDSDGKDFDPNLMEAIDKDNEESQGKKAIVRSVIKEGYSFNEKVIRPAQVVVTYV
ncbi:MAG: nucleotide exchange factor GrpE [bacterium]|nr:nucleotide exchange factor GrpE [bacterium]